MTLTTPLPLARRMLLDNRPNLTLLVSVPRLPSQRTVVVHMADIRRAVSKFVNLGKELCQRMRSDERTMLTEVDLHVLRAQVFFLEHEAITLQKEVRSKSHTPDECTQDRPARDTP